MTETATDWTSCTYGARDEFTHDHRGEPGYNESVYYNFAVADAGEAGPQGGVLRVGLRPTDGYAEMTLLVPLADGRTLFRYVREDLALDEFAAGMGRYRCGPMTIAIEDPNRTITLSYHGEARILPDLAKFGDAPGVEWRAATEVSVAADVRFVAEHPVHVLDEQGGLMPVGEDGHDVAARDHFEQFGVLEGTLAIAGKTYDLTGSRSLRDHSWGPRHWDRNADTDQLMAYFDDGTRVVTICSRIGGDIVAKGMAWLPGAASVVATPHFRPVDEYRGTSTVAATLPLQFSIGERTVDVDATVLSMFPTRVGRTHRDALALLLLDGDLGRGAGWIDMMRPRVDGQADTDA